MFHYKFTYSAPMGEMIMRCGEDCLCGLWFTGGKHIPSDVYALPEKYTPAARETCRWLDIYFCGKEPPAAPALYLNGTPFQMEVWRILRTVAYGETVTYGEIAARLPSPFTANGLAARAAGGAVGRNPVSIIIPCHRVLGKDGSLTGYSGGLDKKIALLHLEGISFRENGL